MAGRNLDSRCKALTKNGKSCRAAATEGGLCFFHANPNKASELGRVGGRSKGRSFVNDSDPLPPLDSMVAVRDAVERVIADVYSGKLHPRVAAGLAPLLQLQLRALDATEMEGRLSRLERLVTKREQSSMNNRGGHQPLIAPRPEPPSAPPVSCETETESGLRTMKAEEGLPEECKKDAPPIKKAGFLEAVEPGAKVEQLPSESPTATRIQDKTARASEAESVQPFPIIEVLPTETGGAGSANNAAVPERERLDQAIKEGWAKFPDGFK
jgi:hypothetical protein